MRNFIYIFYYLFYLCNFIYILFFVQTGVQINFIATQLFVINDDKANLEEFLKRWFLLYFESYLNRKIFETLKFKK